MLRRGGAAGHNAKKALVTVVTESYDDSCFHRLCFRTQAKYDMIVHN